MTGDKQKIPPPVLLSVIICDQVITDSVSGKNTLIGLFDNINAVKFPARHSLLTVFCQLTNGIGKVPVIIRLVDMQNDEKVLGKYEIEEKFQDPREVRNIRVDIGGIVFPQEGEYRLQIYANDDFLGERRIICKKIKQ